MKKQILLGLLAVGMLAACSNDDSLNENQASKYGLVEGQSAFLSLGIAMPSDPQTRANDEFDDGDDTEYAVKQGTLVLFKGANETSAKLVKQYVLPTTVTYSEETGATQITSTSSKFVQEIESPNLTGAEKLYAYVILNDGNLTGISYTVGQTFPEFSKKVLKAIGIANEADGYGAMSTNGLVMTSVPVVDAAGGSAASTGNVTTLTEIQPEAVYDTKAEAEASTADVACIYVERAAVKVDVTFGSTSTPVEDPIDASLDATLLGWCLGNVNSSATGYYNTRQFDNSWLALNNIKNAVATTKYRFACANKLNAGLTGTHDERYRTYFGYDMNYSGTTAGTGLIDGQTAAADHTFGNGDVVYTYENTFDENSQIYANTTYVSLAVKLNNGATFFTLKGEENTAYKNASDLETKLGANMMSQLSAELPTIIATIDSKISADLSGSNTIGASDPSDEVTYKIIPVVTLASAKGTDNTRSYTVALDLDEVKVKGTAATAEQIAAIKALIYDGTTTVAAKLAAATTGKTLETVYEYTDGVTYYATRIAHFGDNETPWSAPAEAFGNYEKIYPTTGTSSHEAVADQVKYGDSRANAWLGRWGIVRNNWYSLSISAIKGIGDPAPLDYSGTGTGEPGGTPDDNPEPKYYIAAHIHILPWVKRVQDVILK